VVLAGILAFVTLPAHALLLRRHPRDLGLQPDGFAADSSTDDGPRRELSHEVSASVREALTDPKFAGLAIAFCLHAFASVGLSVHMVAYLVNRGFDATSAAVFTGVVGAMQVAGRLLFLVAERWFPPRAVSGAIFAAQPISITVLSFMAGPVGVPIFVSLFGMGRGAATLLRPIVVAGLYGPARFGSIAGVLALFTTAAEAGGPFAVGLAYDRFESYEPILWALTAVALLATAAITVADRRTR
jgi:cyanate permease